MIRYVFYLCIINLAGCHVSPNFTPIDKDLRRVNQAEDIRPNRIISLDFCADQYVLKLVEPSRILAVSPDAVKPFSYMREAATGLKSVRPLVEDVLILKPDLVVRSYGGGPAAEAMFKRAGISVLNVGWAGDIDGIRRVTQDMAKGLGEEKAGAALDLEIESRLATLRAHVGRNKAKRKEALYVTPAGTTSGAGSLVHEMLIAAGLQNFQRKAGWQSLPLERLAYENPDVIAAAFFDSHKTGQDQWSAVRHPIARAQMANHPTVHLNGAWMSCGAWFALDAIEALAYANIDDDDENVEEKQ